MSKKASNADNDDEGFDDDFVEEKGTQSYSKNTESRSKVLAILEQQRRLLQATEKTQPTTPPNTLCK